jgi:plasmid stabilization system protein ParE
VRVRFTPEALRSIREKRAWWASNRDKAPRLFVEELAAIIEKLRNGADAERHQFAAAGGRVIWRLLMPKTRHHIYYRRSASGVEVLLVWNAVGKAEPEL